MKNKIYQSKTGFKVVEIRRDLADQIEAIAKNKDRKKREIASTLVEAGLKIQEF